MQAVREIYRAYAGRWDSWRIQSVNRRIFSAIVTVGGFTVLIKLIVAGKEVVVANQFGTGDALDAFLIAFLLPSFAINVVAWSFNAALIPTFIQVREHEGREASQRLFSSVMVWSTGLLIAVSALLAVAAPYILPILGSGFSPEKLELTRSLFFVLLATLTVSGLATIWGAILNASERFALVALAPMMTPVITVVALLVMGKVWGIYSLAVGTVCGVVLEAAVLSRGLRRHGFSIIPRWHGMDPAMKQIINQYAPMIAGAFLMGSTTLVDQTMAAMLGPGSVSALSYGNKVVAFAMGIGAMALSTAVLPHFSRMVAVRDWIGVRHTLKTYARLILLVTIPLTLLLIYFSEPLVRIIFERGAFKVADTHLVSQVQVLCLLQVPFYIMGIMFVRLVSSLKANYILLWGTTISVFLNITLNYLFMNLLGVSGIALSTSVVYAASFCFLLYMVTRLLKKSESNKHG
jgi:putative peptidoglycan lipid II flippase